MSDHEATPEQNEHKARMQALKAKQDAEVRSKEIRRGVIVVNTGDGKGKSSSAFGVALRAAGASRKSLADRPGKASP